MQNKTFSGPYRDTDECSEGYSGPFPFSEPETRNMRDYLVQLRPTPIVAIALHSFSQLWLYSYGDVENHYPPNVKENVSLMNFS